MSTAMGFSKFEFLKGARYYEKSYNYRSGEPVDIRPWSKHHIQWKRKDGILDITQAGTVKNISKTKVKKKDCMHLALSSLFLTATGVITPCCYFMEKPYLPKEIDESITSKKFLPTCIDHCGSQ